MQSELEQVINDFLAKARSKHTGDSYAAGYFSAWIRQLGERDASLRQDIIRQLTFTMRQYL